MPKPTRALLSLMAAAVAIAWSVPAAAQDRAPRPVNVAVPDSHPAFDHSLAGRPANAMEIAVIVHWRDPAEGEPSVVILNPAHATPEALHLGLRQLEAAARHQATGGFRAYPVENVPREVPRHARGQLQGILARVEAAQPEHLPNAARSRYVRLDDLPAYLRTEIIPTRGNPDGRP